MLDSLLIFGPPGAGKSTQAKFIAEKYDRVHISAGELFRDASLRSDEVGELARTIIANATLDADEFSAELVRGAIDSKPSKGYVIDGFPRTVSQISVADRFFHSRDIFIVASIYLHIDDVTAYERMTGRANGSGRLENIRDKIDNYNRQTVPAIEIMCERGNMIRVNALRSVQDVRDAVFEKLDDLGM